MLAAVVALVACCTMRSPSPRGTTGSDHRSALFSAVAVDDQRQPTERSLGRRRFKGAHNLTDASAEILPLDPKLAPLVLRSWLGRRGESSAHLTTHDLMPGEFVKAVTRHEPRLLDDVSPGVDGCKKQPEILPNAKSGGAHDGDEPLRLA
jgi:hypothetical protein